MKQLLSTLLMMLCASTASASQVGVYCMFGAEGSQVYTDENIRLQIVLTIDGTALLEAENLTSEVIYVNRGRSFAWVNGMSVPLDNGQVFDSRLQAIAPHGCTPIYAWEHLALLLNPDIIYIGKPSMWSSTPLKGKFMDTKKKFRKGSKRRYTRNTTPLMLAADVEYGFKEIGNPETRAKVSDYVETIKVESRDYVTKNGELRRPEIFRKPCFAFRSGKSDGTVFAQCLGVAALAGLAVIGAAAEPDEVNLEW